MPVVVDIADRLYDYTDEEKATEAVAEFQDESHLDDAAIIALWGDLKDPRRTALEKRIFDAIDTNGTVKRAQETVPDGVSLLLASDDE